MDSPLQTFISLIGSAAGIALLCVVFGTFIVNVALSKYQICEPKLVQTRAVSVGLGFLFYCCLCAGVGYFAFYLIFILLSLGVLGAGMLTGVYGHAASLKIFLTLLPPHAISTLDLYGDPVRQTSYAIFFLCMSILIITRIPRFKKALALRREKHGLANQIGLTILVIGLFQILGCAFLFPAYFWVTMADTAEFFLMLVAAFYLITLTYAEWFYTKSEQEDDPGAVFLLQGVIQHVDVTTPKQFRDYWKIFGFKVEGKGEFLLVKDVYLIEDLDTDYAVQRKTPQGTENYRVKKAYIEGVRPVLKEKLK